MLETAHTTVIEMSGGVRMAYDGILSDESQSHRL